MSCSDKLAKWQLVGLQGGYLAKFLTAPLRLASITVGALSPVEWQGDARGTWVGVDGAVNSACFFCARSQRVRVSTEPGMVRVWFFLAGLCEPALGMVD